MHDRYTDTEMKEIWSEENKFEKTRNRSLFENRQSANIKIKNCQKE